MESTDKPGNYLNVTQRWWGYPSMHNLLGFDETKKVPGQNGHFYLIWVKSGNAKKSLGNAI